MSYNITRSDNTLLGTIADGSVDSPYINGGHTSLTLIGRNYPNYGQAIVDDFVHLLENFSNNISPPNPLPGQLWWDKANKLLKVNPNGNSGEWKVISSATASAIAPTTTTAGDIWWDTVNKQLYVYDGTSPFALTGWILVGPAYSVLNGKSGALWESIIDTLGTSHHVLTLYLDGQRTGIVSTSGEFTPQVEITNFSTIKPGLNTGAATIWGTANNASYLGNQPAANYFRNNQNNSGTGNLTIVNDTGVTLGSTRQLSLTTHDVNASIVNNSPLGSLNFVTNSIAYLSINGASGDIVVNADPAVNLGVATKQYVDNSFANSPALGGVPTAPTAPAGTATLQIASTDFVINQSGFLKNKIYQGNSYFEIDDTGFGSATLTIDGTSVLLASPSGVALADGATATTQPQTVQNATIATTGYVATATRRWDGAAKFVSTDVPNPGVNDIGSVDGDFWFQYTA